MLFYQLLKHVNVQFFKSNVQFNICISSTKLKERREKTKHNCKIRQFINIIKEIVNYYVDYLTFLIKWILIIAKLQSLQLYRQ